MSKEEMLKVLESIQGPTDDTKELIKRLREELGIDEQPFTNS